MDLSRWIKNVPFETCPPIADYNNIRHFIKVADIVEDKDVKKNGDRRRKTVIKAVPVISTEEFKAKQEWLYIFGIDGYIVKIGGTRDSLANRFASYLCGHHIPERGGSGKCSVTNAHIYNTFAHYLSEGRTITMWAYKLPGVRVTQTILGVEHTFTVQTYHKYESLFLQDFKAKYGAFPFLSDNADPEYKQ
jgi:hypothetical protein